MLEIKNKIEFEGNCWIGSIDPSNFNSSEENRIKAVTDLASITTGRLGWESPKGMGVKEIVEGEDIKWTRRKSLYNRLLTESAGKPSVPFEFIPVITGEWNNIKWLKHSTIINVKNSTEIRNLSNSRNWLNFFMDLRDTIIPEYDEDFHLMENFKIVIGQVPKQVYDHIVMHRSFSRMSESSRNKKYLKNVKFWIDSKQSKELQEMERVDNEQAIKKAWEYIEKGMRAEQATKRLPCTRLITFVLGAWMQDSNSWENLFNTRAEKTGTQEITQQTIDNIKSLIL